MILDQSDLDSSMLVVMDSMVSGFSVDFFICLEDWDLVVNLGMRIYFKLF